MIYTLSFVPGVSEDEIRVSAEISIIKQWVNEHGPYAHVLFRGHTFRVGRLREPTPADSSPTILYDFIRVRDEHEGHGDENPSRELAAVQLANAIVCVHPRTVRSSGWWSLADGTTVQGDRVMDPEDLKSKCAGMEYGWPSLNYFSGGSYGGLE